MASPQPAGWLKYREDRRVLGFAAVYLCLILLQFSQQLSWPVAIVVWCGTCVFSFVGAVSAHNVMHTPLFRSTRLNDAWRIVHTWWYGQPVSFFVPVHNHSHHKHTQSRRDLTRTTKVHGRWQLLNLLVSAQWQRAAARDCRAYFSMQADKGRKIARNVKWEGRAWLAGYATLLLIDWRVAVLGVFIPHQVGGFAIRAINFLQHDGCDYDQQGYNHSRNFVGPVFNWLLMNNGYHTVHHMRPGWHWSTLPQRHAELVHPHIHPSLEVRNSLTFLVRFLVLPGIRLRFDGAPYEGQPGGEGPDLPWDFSVEAAYSAPAEDVMVRKAS